MKVALAWAAGVLAALYGSLVAASYLYLWFVGARDLFVFPFDQWIDAIQGWSATPWMKVYVAGSAMVPASAAILVVSPFIKSRFKMKKLRKPIGGGLREMEQAITENHGDGRYQTMEEAKELYPGPHPLWGGIVIGEAARVEASWGRRFLAGDKSTWGEGGKAPLLIDPCTDGTGSFILFAGSGWYKTSCLVMSIVEWLTGLVVLDVKAEIGPMVKRDLEDRQGKRVHFLNPVRPDDAEKWGYDALGWLKKDSPTFEEDIQAEVAWIYGSPGKEDPFFDPWAKDLIACLLADMLTWDEKSIQVRRSRKRTPLPRITLATLRRGITTPETQMRSLLRGIYKHSNSMFARDIAGTLMDAVDKQFSGIYGTAVKSTAWLSVPSLADLVSGDAFEADEITKGKSAVFIQVSSDTLAWAPGVARVILGSIAKSIVRAAADGRMVGKALMMLDEVRLLQHMQLIEDIRDLGRASGMVLGLTYQTVGLLKDQWGQSGKEKWFSTVSWRGYCSIRDVATAEELAKECGQHGAMAYSEGDNTGSQGRAFSMFNSSRSVGHNTNVHEISAPTAFLHDVLCKSRTDEMWVVGTGQWALRCSRPIYFRRPEYVARIDVSKYVHLPSEGDEPLVEEGEAA